MKRRYREFLAAGLALLLGLPLFLAFTLALRDGATRQSEAPLRAILGNDVFEALRSGEAQAKHYLGDELLAPDFALRDHRGKMWRLRDHRGKVVVLNFWSITCPPCLEEMPSLDELTRIVAAEKDIEVVTVSIDKGWESVRSLFAQEPSFKVLFDPERKVVSGRFGTKLFPETWIIDPEGVIRFRFDGPLEWSRPLVVDLIRSFR